MSKTIFEKIIDRQIPAEIFFDTSNVLAFLDINPVSFGHTLLISKEPHQWIQDVPADELGQIFSYVPRIINALMIETSSDYVQVAVMGLDVPHFHIHLIPRNFGDNHNELYPNDSLKDIDVKELANALRKSLGSDSSLD